MSKKAVWLEYLEAIIIAFVLAMIIRAFLVQAYQIPSGSMLDTLLIGDRLLVNKFVYGVKMPFTDKIIFEVGDPTLGDVIVFVYPEDHSVDYVKRIVGLPGDTLEMRGKVLFRNGQPMNETYVRYTDRNIRLERDNFPSMTIPPDQYFVMGDNRDDSRDSRYWGLVDRKLIHGKAWRIYWSWGSKKGDAGSSGYDDTGLRLNRLGKLIE
jgi:signal peptidase I